jgi:hypothetical protein
VQLLETPVRRRWGVTLTAGVMAASVAVGVLAGGQRAPLMDLSRCFRVADSVVHSLEVHYNVHVTGSGLVRSQSKQLEQLYLGSFRLSTGETVTFAFDTPDLGDRAAYFVAVNREAENLGVPRRSPKYGTSVARDVEGAELSRRCATTA